MTDPAVEPWVVAVSRSPGHTFTKANCASINLLSGLGVEGDAHLGKTVKHRSRVKADPTQPNLRQVHLIQEELLHSLQKQGFRVGPGVMGENITTSGIDLLDLPEGTMLKFGDSAMIAITGLRNPCKQLDRYQRGLMDAVLERKQQGELIRKAGVMGIVMQGGLVKPGDTILIILPDPPYQALDKV